MSTDYDIICKEHKELVSCCSDGFSGPLLQCDKSLAAFSITHRDCALNIIDEHMSGALRDAGQFKYLEWHKGNWESLLCYDKCD